MLAACLLPETGVAGDPSTQRAPAAPATHRLAALVAGVAPPENMRRCFANNYDVEGFWKGWHSSYNQVGGARVLGGRAGDGGRVMPPCIPSQCAL